MTLLIDTAKVAAKDFDNCWLVGFADHEFETKHSLTVQRAFYDDEQVVGLGMNTYHIGVDDQGRSYYGGIERSKLHRNQAIVTFSPDGQRHVGVNAASIRFKIGRGEHARLHERLSNIFRRTDVYIRM